MSKFDFLKTPSTSRSVERSSSIPFEFFTLIQKMNRLNSQAQTDLTKNIFHLMGQERQKSNALEDPVTKLKNIENKSEMNRASVELIAQRKPKRYSLRSHRYKEGSEEKESYLNIYREMKKQKLFKEAIDTEMNSEDEGEHINQTGPAQIKHYRYLKEHPKILNFTLDKIKEKNVQNLQKSRKEDEKSKMKSGSQLADLTLSQQFKQMFEEKRKSHVDVLESPKSIVDNQLTKFYSKSSMGKIDVKIRDNPRCNRLLLRQDQILAKAEQRHVSKENIKKLKQKLNSIVNEIRKDDKRTQELLPTINTSLNGK